MFDAGSGPHSSAVDAPKLDTPPNPRRSPVKRTFAAVASQRPLPDGYSPGRIRAESDEEAGAVSLFLADHPEHEALAPEVIQQVMDLSTMRKDRGRELRRAEGIPQDWHRSHDDYGFDPIMSDDV
jgi:hypothetical protein